MSYGPAGTQHDKDRNPASFRSQTSPFIPIPASQDTVQRALAASNNPLRPSLPSSKQPDQRSSLGLKSLLNPVEDEDHANAGSASGSLNLPEKTTISPNSAKIHVPALPLSRSSFSERETQYSVPFIGQTQLLLSNRSLSSGAASIMPQMTFDANAFEVPTLSLTAQSQSQLITLETKQGSIRVPCDLQTASRAADERRKRNAGCSKRFRQRRQAKERETLEKIKKLEARLHEITEEKDRYLMERDHLRDLVSHHDIQIAPRLPSPRHRRSATLGGASLP